MGWPIFHYLGLTQSALLKGWVWQLLTFQFLHIPTGVAGLCHLAFNCLGIYTFGRAVEEVMGRAGFLKLYFLSGAFGAIGSSNSATQ